MGTVFFNVIHPLTVSFEAIVEQLRLSPQRLLSGGESPEERHITHRTLMDACCYTVVYGIGVLKRNAKFPITTVVPI